MNFDPTSFTIPESQDGQRLDRYLKSQKIPFGLIQKGLRTGKIRVNGVRQSGEYRLSAGDIITLKGIIQPQPSGETEPQISQSLLDDLSEAILFHDDDFLILDKPKGISSQGGTGISFGLDQALKLLPSLKKVSPKIVHRLDKETTGCMIFALNREAAHRFGEQFKKGKISKTYVALCRGVPEIESGEISMPLKKGVKGQLEIMVPDTGGQKALTQFDVVARSRNKQFSLLQCTPLTGRKHQIRAHLAFMETPLLGDRKYNPEESEKSFFLHAYQLSWQDENGKTWQFTAPLPEAFLEKLNQIGFQKEDLEAY